MAVDQAVDAMRRAPTRMERGQLVVRQHLVRAVHVLDERPGGGVWVELPVERRDARGDSRPVTAALVVTGGAAAAASSCLTRPIGRSARH